MTEDHKKQEVVRLIKKWHRNSLTIHNVFLDNDDPDLYYILGYHFVPSQGISRIVLIKLAFRDVTWCYLKMY